MKQHRDERRRVGSQTDRFGLPRWMYATRTVRVGGVIRQWPPPPPFVPRPVRPIYRVWWAWAVLGSIVVALASITFVDSSESAPVVTPAAGSVASTPSSHTGSGGAASQPSAPSTPTDGVAQGLPLGDYAGQSNDFGVATFGLATGTVPSFATDYLDKTGGWAAMDGAAGVKAWSPTRYHLVLGVPMLPGVGTLGAGATGAYNQYFTTLGQNLVGDHEATAILRLGWEFNGSWFPWSVATATDASNFVAYWRQIVTTLRAVPGQEFRFLWNPNAPSPTRYTPAQAYPGNAYVDYVGTDVYDNFWGKPFTPAAAWIHQLTQQWGLDWLSAFAVEHGKPVAIPEWSDEFRPDGHGLGDDPSFIDNMADWFVSNNVAFTDVWSYDSSPTYRNNLLDGTFPKSLARFKADFG
ncbi:MAG TPA: glycosyl hydrolase [Acidimicrobiales bacterium]